MDKIKTVILGSSNSGKTTILTQYLQRKFMLNNQMTTAPDKNIKQISLKNKNILLEIWDTPGNQNYYPLNEIIVKNSKIILLVYDITNRNSFERLKYIIHLIKKWNKEEIVISLIGNKNDLEQKREINKEEGKKFAEDNNYLFFETNGKDYDSIENIFTKICLYYLEYYKKEIEEEEMAIKEGKKIIKYNNGDKYIGFLKNGNKEGEGKMKYINGDIYVGNWKKNLREGEGKMEYINGDIYIGNWKNNLREGEGKIIDKDKNVYKGNWKNDLRHGEGELIKNNGDEYKLKWQNGIVLNGIINFKNGNIYEGELKEYEREGKGIMKYKNGEIYDGEWKKDLREGKGKLNSKECLYDGEWKNNELNGKGKIYYNNNKIFDGYFINGKREGKGIIINQKGDNLEINFKNDKIEGKGKLIYKNGNILEGNFDNNYNPIYGILTYLNGDIYEGNFDENGKRIGKGIMKNKNGEIYYGEWNNNNEGLFCLNEYDYCVLKKIKINENNVSELFNLNLNDLSYIGNYENNNKEGEGILYMYKFNNLSIYKIIYHGNFKNNLKDGFGKIYYETGSIFESYWKEDKIDNEKESIFHLNNLIQFKNSNLNLIEWINFINIEIFKNIGNINLNNSTKINIR